MNKKIIILCLFTFVLGIAGSSTIKSSKEKQQLAKEVARVLIEVQKITGPYEELRCDARVIDKFFEVVSKLTEDDAIDYLIKTAVKEMKGNLRRFRFYMITALGYHKNKEVYALFEKLLVV